MAAPLRCAVLWRSRTPLALGVLAAFLALFPITGVRPAAAHPLGNFTVNRYARIELYRDAIHIQYVLDFAEIPTFQLLNDIDTDGNGETTQAELEAYVAKLAPTIADGFALTLDGKRVAATPLDRAIGRSAGQAGLDVLRVSVLYVAPLPPGLAGPVAVAFADHNYPDRVGWREIVVRPSEGAQVTVDPKYTVDLSDALRNYPTDTLRSAPEVTEVAFGWVAGTGAPAPQVAQVAAGAQKRVSGGFSALLERRQSLLVVVLSVVAAFGFGMLHALGPGHGKTVVAAYLVGSRGTARHAVALGLTVTATHTSTVYLIGFLTLAGSAYFAPDRVYLYLGVAAGVSIVLMGTILFAARLLDLYRRGSQRSHRHGLFARPHAHGSDGHDGALAGPAGPDHGHGPAPVAVEAAGRVSWRSLLTLGVVGGLLPCPSAIIVMLAAIAIGQVVYGMLLIVAFSAGLAGVLTAIGITLVLGKRLSRRSRLVLALDRPSVSRVIAALPVVSALVIVLAGIAVTYQALQQPGL